MPVSYTHRMCIRGRGYIQQFMQETFETPYYLRRAIEVKFSEMTAEWRINGKSSPSYNDVAAYTTYGTDRANAVSYTHLRLCRSRSSRLP